MRRDSEQRSFHELLVVAVNGCDQTSAAEPDARCSLFRTSGIRKQSCERTEHLSVVNVLGGERIHRAEQDDREEVPSAFFYSDRVDARARISVDRIRFAEEQLCT